MKTVYFINMTNIHRLLYIYNGAVVLLMAAFISVTQYKIIKSMEARDFLENTPLLPPSAAENFVIDVMSFLFLAVLSRIYVNLTSEVGRFFVAVLEVAACVAVMRGINLAYDGVVFLIVADLMNRYEGRNQEYILLAVMVGLGFIVNYNLAVLKMFVVPIDAYLSYYGSAAQTIL